MFDVVGRRKWFYIFSLAITIPGLLFILLTLIPGGKMGLQFSIAYRGGTSTDDFRTGVEQPLSPSATVAVNVTTAARTESELIGIFMSFSVGRCP